MKLPSLIEAIREQGREEGAAWARRSIMENLIASGMNPAQAAAVTGLGA